MTPEDILCIIKCLQMMSPAQRRAFFDLSSKKQMNVLEEVFLNLLKNPRGVSKAYLAVAKRYSKQIKRLADRNISVQTKRTLLKQRGGFLGALLPVLGSLLAGFITK
jgi:hypothetical protein